MYLHIFSVFPFLPFSLSFSWKQKNISIVLYKIKLMDKKVITIPVNSEIFAKSVKRHIYDIKKSRVWHDLPILVNNRVISPFCEGFIFAKLRNFRILQYIVKNLKSLDLYTHSCKLQILLRSCLYKYTCQYCQYCQYHTQSLGQMRRIHSYTSKAGQELNKKINIPLRYMYLVGTQPKIFGPRCQKTCLRGFANNTSADQPAHPRLCYSFYQSGA